MSRDFIQEFKNKVREIDGGYEVPKARYDEAVTMIEPLFSIYKRAVPFAKNPLNRRIALGLTRKEADEMTLKLIRKESARRVEEWGQDIYFMYEIIPTNATLEETSPFYNEGSPVQ